MTTTAIRTEGLTKRYGGFDTLGHLDLEVPAGEVPGYLGPNGAGEPGQQRGAEEADKEAERSGAWALQHRDLAVE